ncbi:MAG: hypothetical protein ABSE77_09340 [Acidimicrobiales bacterium]
MYISYVLAARSLSRGRGENGLTSSNAPGTTRSAQFVTTPATRERTAFRFFLPGRGHEPRRRPLTNSEVTRAVTLRIT